MTRKKGCSRFLTSRKKQNMFLFSGFLFQLKSFDNKTRLSDSSSASVRISHLGCFPLSDSFGTGCGCGAREECWLQELPSWVQIQRLTKTKFGYFPASVLFCNSLLGRWALPITHFLFYLRRSTASNPPSSSSTWVLVIQRFNWIFVDLSSAYMSPD